VKKCPIHFNTEVSMVTVLSNIEITVYRIQQKVGKEQLTVMDMWT